MKYIVILIILGVAVLYSSLPATEGRTIAPLHIVLENDTIKDNSFITAKGGIPVIEIQKQETVSFPFKVNPRTSEPLPVNFSYSIEVGMPGMRQAIVPDMKIELDPFHMVLNPDESQIMNVTITALNYTELGLHRVILVAQEPQGEKLLNTSFDILVIDDKVIDDTNYSEQTKIENINGKLFRVIGSYFTVPESNKEIHKFDGVEFSNPYYPVEPFLPGGVFSVDIKFDDGVKENIGGLGPHHLFLEFTNHNDPQAGVRGNSEGGFDFLISVENYYISPLKQFNLGIPLNKMQCKDGLVLIEKYDGSPACVKPETKQKLIERGWANINTDNIRQTVSLPSPPDPMSITITGNNKLPIFTIKRGETKEIGILLEPKIPITFATVSVDSYFGSAGNCNNISTDSYCPGRGIIMNLSETEIAAKKEITLTITIPENMTVGTYGYQIETKTTFDISSVEKPRTIGNSVRFDLKVI